MSNGSKAVLIAVIIIILGGAAWALSSSSNTPAPVAVQPVDQAAASTTADASVQPAAAPDTSDASINADVSSVDSQMDGLNADNSSSDKAALTQ